MKKITFLFLTILLNVPAVYCQIAINTNGSSPDNSAMLDVQSTAKGILIPRMTAAQRDAITSPATGLTVFVTDDSTFYFYSGSRWEKARKWILENSRLYTDTTLSVGIGTSTPGGKFEVATLYYSGTYGSDVCTGGTASASEFYGPGYEAGKAFDNNTASYWTNKGTLPAWLQYDFGSGNEKRVSKYRIYFENPTSDYTHSPDSWTLEASNDGNSWTTLDTRTGQGWTANEWKEYIFSNTTYYRYYRINISDNNGSGDNYVSIYEMEMMEENLSNHTTLFVNDNKVGIGTASPAKTLDVNGSFKLSDGTEAAGKILSCDASGNAGWVDGTTVNGGGWTVSGSSIYSTGHSVGIGTSSPTATLDVQGRIAQTGTGYSVFLGEDAGKNDDLSDNYNVFVGYQAGQANTDGYYNSANGAKSLYSNTTGNKNTATGYQALYNNTSGHSNTAIGEQALLQNISGYGNTSIGAQSLSTNSIGHGNTANGFMALHLNTGGSLNTANGYEALYNNTTGDHNTANGHKALYNNTSGDDNTAIGQEALLDNTIGHQNTALGYHAFYDGLDYHNSTALGYNTNITASNQIRLGNSSVTSIGGHVSWTTVSDKRFKKDVSADVPGLDFILKLKPVTYHLDMDAIARFNHTADSLRLPDAEKAKGTILQTGFIAQEVEQAAQSIGYDFSGVDAPKNKHDYYGLRYAEFVVPLVKAVQEQQEKIEEQQKTIEALQSRLAEMETLKKRLERVEKKIN